MSSTSSSRNPPRRASDDAEEDTEDGKREPKTCWEAFVDCSCLACSCAGKLLSTWWNERQIKKRKKRDLREEKEATIKARRLRQEMSALLIGLKMQMSKNTNKNDPMYMALRMEYVTKARQLNGANRFLGELRTEEQQIEDTESTTKLAKRRAELHKLGIVKTVNKKLMDEAQIGTQFFNENGEVLQAQSRQLDPLIARPLDQNVNGGLNGVRDDEFERLLKQFDADFGDETNTNHPLAGQLNIYSGIEIDPSLFVDAPTAVDSAPPRVAVTGGGGFTNPPIPPN